MAGAPLVPWSNDTTRAGIGLQRTTPSRCARSSSRPPPRRSVGQLARLAFPLGIGGQGVLLEPWLRRRADLGRRGAAAERHRRPSRSTRTASAPRPRGAADGHGARPGPAPEHGPDRYVTVVGQVMPGWVLVVLARRCCCRSSSPASMRSRARAAGAWRSGRGCSGSSRGRAVPRRLGLAQLLELVGATPAPPPAPVAPDLFRSTARRSSCSPWWWRRWPSRGRAARGSSRATGPRLTSRRPGRRRWPSPWCRASPGCSCGCSIRSRRCRRPGGPSLDAGALIDPPAAAAHAGGADRGRPGAARAARRLLAVRLDLDPLGGAWYLLLLDRGHLGLGAGRGGVFLAVLGAAAGAGAPARAGSRRAAGATDSRARSAMPDRALAGERTAHCGVDAGAVRHVADTRPPVGGVASRVRCPMMRT